MYETRAVSEMSIGLILNFGALLFLALDVGGRFNNSVHLSRTAVALGGLCMAARVAARLLTGDNLNAAYVAGLLFAFLLALLGEVLLVAPGSTGVLPALLFFLLSSATLASAFTAPTLPRVRSDGTVDVFGRLKEAARVGTRTWRAFAVRARCFTRAGPVLGATAALITAAGLGAFGSIDSSLNIFFLPVACAIVSWSIALARALARVGYLAPRTKAAAIARSAAATAVRATAWAAAARDTNASIGTAAAARARSLAMTATATAARLAAPLAAPWAERRVQQWAAVVGVIVWGAAWLLAASPWLPPPVEGTGGGGSSQNASPAGAAAGGAVLSLLARAVLTWSLPGTRGARARALPHSLDDAGICPEPTLGRRVHVLIALPGGDGGFDAAEVACVWWYLTRRGHAVSFAAPFAGGVREANGAWRALRASPASVRGRCGLNFCGGGGDAAAAEGRNEAQARRGGARPQSLSQSQSQSRTWWCSHETYESDDEVEEKKSDGVFLPQSCAAAGHRVRGGLCCAPWECAGAGAPAPAIIAMYREMRRAEAFQGPLNLCAAATAAAASRYDGLVVAGVPGAAGLEPFGPRDDGPPCALLERDLLVLIKTFFDNGRPLAVLSNAAVAVARVSGPAVAVAKVAESVNVVAAVPNAAPNLAPTAVRAGRLRGRRSAAPSAAQVWGGASFEVLTGCDWRSLARARAAARLGTLPAAVVARACGSASLVLTSPRGMPVTSMSSAILDFLGSGEVTLPGLRHVFGPDASRQAVVVCDGAYASAQSREDALVLAAAFSEMLDAVSLQVF